MIMASARSTSATRSASATRRSSSVNRRSSAMNQLQNISSFEASGLSAEVAEITSRMESATVHSALEVGVCNRNVFYLLNNDKNLFEFKAISTEFSSSASASASKSTKTSSTSQGKIIVPSLN